MPINSQKRNSKDNQSKDISTLTRRSRKQDVSENGKAKHNSLTSSQKKIRNCLKERNAKSVRSEKLPTESASRGSEIDIRDTPLVSLPSADQCRSGINTPLKKETYTDTSNPNSVAVIDSNGIPLMPTTPARARKWIKERKATPFFRKGIFCVRLNQEPSDRQTQQMVLGIDPGSKWEGYTVSTEAHVCINVQADAIDGDKIKKKVETRKTMRRSRRNRNTPCRKNKSNKSKGKSVIHRVAPSTRARITWRINIVKVLKSIFPIKDIVVEDIAAITKKGKRKWNESFSNLEVGKMYFYSELEKFGTLHIMKGYETAEIRNRLGLFKTSDKSKEVFAAHCVDSFAMGWSVVGGGIPDNTRLYRMLPVQVFRRQLHVMQFAKKGKRRRMGGTVIPGGMKKGSLVRHKEYGLCIVGGYHYVGSKLGISLSKVGEVGRITQDARIEDMRILSYNGSRTRLLPHLKEGDSDENG